MRLFRACLDSETFSICDNSECEIQDIELFYYLMVDHRSVYSELTCSEGWIPALLRAGG